MVLPAIVKLILASALVGVLGSAFGGLAAVARGLMLSLLLTLAIPVLNVFTRKLEDEDDDTPPFLPIHTIVCGLVVGVLVAMGVRWLDVVLPYPLATPHMPGWAQDLSAVLYGVLMLLAYRTRLLSRGWHGAMPYMVWCGAAIADGVRFLPLLVHVPSFAAPAFLGAFANVSIFSLGWVLSLRLHDSGFLPFEEEYDEPRFRVKALARWVAAGVALLVCMAFLFARQAGFAHAWYTEVVWQNPELAEGLGGALYLGELSKDSRTQLNLVRTSPEKVWPKLLERTTRGDAVLSENAFIVSEHTAVRAWDLETGEVEIEFPMEWASIALSPDHEQIACVGNHAGDPINALRVEIIQASDGMRTQELGVSFERQGICWTADGKRLVGVLGKGEGAELFAVPLHQKDGTSQGLGPGTRPRLDPETGDILYLHANGLWRRDLNKDEPELIVGGLSGVVDFRLTNDPNRILVTRERFHRFSVTRHYVLVVDVTQPEHRHILSSKHIPPWCMWRP